MSYALHGDMQPRCSGLMIFHWQIIDIISMGKSGPLLQSNWQYSGLKNFIHSRSALNTLNLVYSNFDGYKKSYNYKAVAIA